MPTRRPYSWKKKVPYQPWCEVCLKYRGKPDRRLRTGASHSGGIPIISLDFAYTKAGEVDRAPMARDPGHDPGNGEMFTDLYEQEEHAEVNFVQSLGHVEIA